MQSQLLNLKGAVEQSTAEEIELRFALYVIWHHTSRTEKTPVAEHFDSRGHGALGIISQGH